MSETLARMPVTIAPSDLPAPRDPDLPYTISMVCTGNICRSAMAEVVLIDRLAAAGVPARGPAGVVVTSAGVSDEEHGNPIERRARRLLTAPGTTPPRVRPPSPSPVTPPTGSATPSSRAPTWCWP